MIMDFFKRWKETLVVIIIGISFFGGVVVGNRVIPPPMTAQEKKTRELKDQAAQLEEMVLPKAGFQTKIALGDAVPKLIENGVIDRQKFDMLYTRRGGLSPEQKALLDTPSAAPLRIDSNNAAFLLNLLWPLGIANKSLTLETSEAAEPENVNNLAATGGWSLGKSENGGDYYNKFEIVKLTPEQDELVKRVAENMFRPCCGNSTAFPDCNHGAALLGMLELGAAQGLSEKELYEEALKFNSFWFPDNYLKMASMFQYFENTSWNALDPKKILSKAYSSGGGFQRNVLQPLSQIPGVLPEQSGGGSCGV